MKTTQDRGRWFQTFTGRQFWPVAPRPEDFDIRDIAHQLANICRFGGATRKFYPVASHCVHVSRLVPPEFAFEGLMHDAPEAYLGDVIRPLKYQMPQYLAIEKRCWLALAQRYDLPEEMSPRVKEADNVALVTERRDLLVHTSNLWSPDLEAVKPDRRHVTAHSPKQAEQAFLTRFYELTDNI